MILNIYLLPYMTNELNTAFKIHQEIYDTRILIQNKKTECSKLKEYINSFNNDCNYINKNINETNLSIKSLDNFLYYEASNPSYLTTLSIKKEYTDELQTLNEDMTHAKNRIVYYENELKRKDIEFMAHITYIDNLYKMIPRINRWSNILNMSEYEKDIEEYHNNNNFLMQLSHIDNPRRKRQRY